MKTKNLKHATREIPGGGLILVLDTGAEIGPEAEAMLQALHSRSIGGIRSHLEVLAKRGPEGFMKTYYVGYNHKSIGDCGTATIFIEGVSMLVAKAFQDWPLYSGQESSTRYIDFAEQRFVNPSKDSEGEETLEEWRNFYVRGLPKVIQDLKAKHPRKQDEKEGIWEKAINARAFDIMRGMLPAGATTNLAWHSNLRQVADELALLRHHPLKEVRDTVKALEEALMEAFPSSFGHKRYPKTEEYNERLMSEWYLHQDEDCPDFELSRDTLDRELLKREYGDALRLRPPKTELPKKIKECGNLQFKFLLDFGSFRDVQRHRAVVQQMPLVTTRHGFNPWYLKEMPSELRKEAQKLIARQGKTIRNLDVSDTERQYYTAMGYNLPNRLTGDLHALVYMVELRATRFVHPTLRFRARQIAETLEQELGNIGLVLHLDTEPDRFDTKRGEQDIVSKE